MGRGWLISRFPNCQMCSCDMQQLQIAGDSSLGCSGEERSRVLLCSRCARQMLSQSWLLAGTDGQHAELILQLRSSAPFGSWLPSLSSRISQDMETGPSV